MNPLNRDSSSPAEALCFACCKDDCSSTLLQLCSIGHVGWCESRQASQGRDVSLHLRECRGGPPRYATGGCTGENSRRIGKEQSTQGIVTPIGTGLGAAIGVAHVVFVWLAVLLFMQSW